MTENRNYETNEMKLDPENAEKAGGNVTPVMGLIMILIIIIGFYGIKALRGEGVVKDPDRSSIEIIDPGSRTRVDAAGPIDSDKACTCPVCKKRFDSDYAEYQHKLREVDFTLYFDTETCYRQFLDNPKKYYRIKNISVKVRSGDTDSHTGPDTGDYGVFEEIPMEDRETPLPYEVPDSGNGGGIKEDIKVEIIPDSQHEDDIVPDSFEDPEPPPADTVPDSSTKIDDGISTGGEKVEKIEIPDEAIPGGHDKTPDIKATPIDSPNKEKIKVEIF